MACERRREDRQGLSRRHGHALARRHRKITVVIEEKYTEFAVHKSFELDQA